MAEETEKSTENIPENIPTTAEDKAEYFAPVKIQGEVIGLISIKDWYTPPTWGAWRSHTYHPEARLYTYRDEGLFVLCTAEQVTDANKLALAGEIKSQEESSAESQPETATGTRSTSEETTAKLLINSAVAEVERSREIMQRDEDEIQRLKEETRAILTKLQAA